jgi:hypothetical protein
MVRRWTTCRICIVAALLAVVSPTAEQLRAERTWEDGHGRPPVYQRRAFEHGHWRRHGRHHPHHDFQFVAPPVSASWFQRPYPYHLDYYRMRYGGSYAPYFGNLYGPPQVVTAPPYFGPYYGGYGESGAYGYGGAYNAAPVIPQRDSREGISPVTSGNDDDQQPLTSP